MISGRRVSTSISCEDTAVARLSELVALRCGYSSSAARRLRAAALLHDIGKLAIPGHILNKPGKLTAAEFAVIKTHTLIGARMLSGIPGGFGIMARNIALFHHERYSGGGGYWGVPLSRLPAYISIVHICDIYTALLSERVYQIENNGLYIGKTALLKEKRIHGSIRFLFNSCGFLYAFLMYSQNKLIYLN